MPRLAAKRRQTLAIPVVMHRDDLNSEHSVFELALGQLPNLTRKTVGDA